MARKKKRSGAKFTEEVTARVEPWLKETIVEYAEKLNTASKVGRITESDAVRYLLLKGLRAAGELEEDAELEAEPDEE